MTVTRGVVQPQTNPVPLRICLGGEDSGGRLAAVEMALDPASGPPLRLHPTHGERFDVLAGKLTLQLGEEIVTGGPGIWAFAPPDIPPERSAADGAEAVTLAGATISSIRRRATAAVASTLASTSTTAARSSSPTWAPVRPRRPARNPSRRRWAGWPDR